MSSNFNEPKNKKKNFSFFGIENASPTFQKIITKYRKNKSSNMEKGKNILAIVEKARNKYENAQTEEEYLLKELRNDRKFIRKLIFLYGQRAGNHYHEINDFNEFKSKVDKNFFFTPKEIQKIKIDKNRIKTQKNSIPLLPNFITNKKKSLDKLFKSTISKEKPKYNLSKNSTGMLGFYNTTSNIKFIRTNNNRKNNINQMNINEFSKNILAIDTRKEYLNTNGKLDSIRDKIEFLDLKKNSLYKNKTNKEFHLKRKVYMDNIVKIKKDFTKTKNEFRKHFTTNDYGCNYSKLQYQYLEKKYFKY